MIYFCDGKAEFSSDYSSLWFHMILQKSFFLNADIIYVENNCAA